MEDHIEVPETVVLTSEGSSSGDEDSGVGAGLLQEPVIRGVRNGGPPHFVTKLYDLVSDKTIDSTISWVNMENQVSGGAATSFAIWNDVDFVNNVLPLMSKSNKFDSFISQLNNYGFKKVSWDRREYANKWFQEGKPHLLNNIKRRSSKENKSDNDKITREIQKLESESKNVDHELHAFKAYIDNAISKLKQILQAIEIVIKSIQHHCRSHGEVVNSDSGSTLAGHETSEFGESSFPPSC
ncbi:hypothetical protein R6Q59_016637 [Mikania micrantha]